MNDGRLGRRARYRTQTRDEIKQIALRQIATAGVEALSLNGVAREMGMTGPALYRYFAGRDELLGELVADAYGDLADAVEAAAIDVPDVMDVPSPPGGAGLPAAGARHVSRAGHVGGRDGKRARCRLRAVAAAYRAWALAQPHRYLLLGAHAGSGALAPERTIPAAHRTMSVILDALSATVPESAANDLKHAQLDGQLETWSRQREGPAVNGRVARLGVTLWTRLHGVLSLELGGHFAAMGFDSALLYDAEVEALLDEAGALSE